MPGSEFVARHVCPAFVVVQVQPEHERQGEKQTTPSLQLSANGSPHAVPPSWQQAPAGRVEATITQTTMARKRHLAIEDTVPLSWKSWRRTASLVPMKARARRETGQESSFGRMSLTG